MSGLQHHVHPGNTDTVTFYVFSIIVTPTNSPTVLMAIFQQCLQCFDAVGWAAGRASGL